jgi:hypothetical protein
MHVAPATVGVRAIGHTGFFRRALAPTLWRQALHFIRTGEVQPLSTAPAARL